MKTRTKRSDDGWRPLACSLALAAAASAAPKVDFSREVRPVLAENCFACHGPDVKKVKGGLRLDVRDVATRPLDSGATAIIPGRTDESELVRRIFATDPDEQMPPAETHKALTAAQKDLLKRWIAEGAEYRGHWAYEMPKKVAVPAGENPIDFLVRQRLQELSLEPSPETDRRTLARRVHFDLVGLPPKPEEVAVFERDGSRDAYEKLVERLLDSPHYGERMAIGWLDVVRFADTIGYHSDNPRNIWPYRDYVIRSFNRNTPFDRFTREQLAGDLLPSPTLEQKVASGFNRLLLTTEEGGAQPKDYEARQVTDRVRAVGAVWLGQTIGCAQCHDHKFDPITTRDFYSLGAFFADVKEAAVGHREDGILVPTEAQVRELERRAAEATRLQKELDGPHPEQKDPSPELADLRRRLAAAQKARADFEATVPRTLITERAREPRTVRILPRGDWMNETGEVVGPALPAFLVRAGGGSSAKKLDRLDLANWLVSRENPLTARTVVNRWWKQFFGLGLAKVLDDLGAQGEVPSHPELLDWLACEFMESGWDVKHIVRLMVTSETYRQTSIPTRPLAERDPENRHLARQSRWRLEAELVRDNALELAGLLDPTIGGPSAKPYQPDGYWENLNFPPRTYEASTGPSQYRRGVYTWWQRTFLHPSMVAFDAPSREECTADRSRSNIPQQALALLHDPTYVEAARAFAARILREGSGDENARIVWAWRQALARTPQLQEIATLRALLDKHRGQYHADRSAAEAYLSVGRSKPPADLDAAELAAWTNLTRTLLNLHETITRS